MQSLDGIKGGLYQGEAIGELRAGAVFEPGMLLHSALSIMHRSRYAQNFTVLVLLWTVMACLQGTEVSTQHTYSLCSRRNRVGLF